MCHMMIRKNHKRLSGSFIANISVIVNLMNSNPPYPAKTTSAAALGSFRSFATGRANMYANPTMIEMENRAYFAMFAQNGMSSPAMDVCDIASET